MSLTVVQGPPNSGRAGLVRRAVLERLYEEPVLVVPTVDDVYRFERELCADGPVLGALTTTFDGLFEAVATAGGAPPAAPLTRSQRLGAVRAAVTERLPGLGPLRRSAGRPGFPGAFERLLEELQSAGRLPADVEAAAGTLEGSAYLADVAGIFAAYARRRDDLGSVDRHGVALEAIELLRHDAGFWSRPVFVYGVDDMTANQLTLVRALAGAVDVTVAIPFEAGSRALAPRTAPLLEALETGLEASSVETHADPANTVSPLLFALERGFAGAGGEPASVDESLVVLRSAGARGEAEAIAVEVARLLAAGVEPEEVAIVVRDPSRRGPLLAATLERCGIPAALEAETAVGSTAVGGCLSALLEALFGNRRATDLMRYLRGPSAIGDDRVDWFERRLRRGRVRDAAEALRLWEEKGDPPADIAALREAAADPAALAAAVGRLAEQIGGRAADELEARAAGAIANTMSEWAALPGLAPQAAALGREIATMPMRVWSGPVEDRVRIADPYRLRAARFDHVFVASLQEGEFPRTARPGDPFLSEAQREALGLQPRHDTEAEERYLFHACLALPRRRLYLSYRDSDENGVAEAPSPLLDEVRALLVAEDPDGDPLGPLTRGRDLATVVHTPGEAPSETELARAIAARGPNEDVTALLRDAGVGAAPGRSVEARLEDARGSEAATRAPGPLAEPAVLEALRKVEAHGGTTLEGFDQCSYRWFVSHELRPEPLDPVPDPLVQGGIVHQALETLYRERPGGTPLPTAASLDAWTERSAALVDEIGDRRGLGTHPAERAMLGRVRGLLARFLSDEARRELAGFEPILIEARFGEDEEAEKPSLDIDGWRLHGAIDRVDRTPDGRALVIDYKASSSVTSCKKLEEEAKLQLQLYLIAIERLWGEEPAGGIYHPLRGTSRRQPRGLYLEDAAEELEAYALSSTDRVDPARFEELLADARRRAGTIVERMRAGDITRDPGPRRPLKGHDVCISYCDFAPICRRDRAPVEPMPDEEMENGE